MKFKINQNNFWEGLSTVLRAISSKSISLELEGVLIEAKDNKIKLTGTDAQELSIETFIDAQIIEEGITLVNARLLGDVVRKLPHDDITVTVLKDRMNLKVQNSNFDLLTLNPDEYPSIPKVGDEKSITINSQVLSQAIKQTSFGVSLDLNRRTLMGVLFELNKNKINFVSLDGIRLSVFSENIDSDLELSAIVPAKSLDELSRTIGEEDFPVKISFTDNNVKFDLVDTCFYSGLIEGNFFNYKDIIRKEHEIYVSCDRKNLVTSLERAELLAKSEKAKLVKLEFDGNTLKILSNTELGSVEELVDIDKNGDSLTIGFNSKFLLDGLKNMEEDTINLLLKNEISPLIINGEGNDDYLYLVLPVRLA